VSAVPAAKAIRRAPAKQAAPAPRLQVVTAPKRSRGYVPYLACCLAFIAAGSGIVLWLNTALAAGSFEIHNLEAELANYQTLKESAEEQLAMNSEVAALSAKATELGMVPAPAGAYIVLRDGTVVGQAVAAGTDEPDAEGAAEGAAQEGTQEGAAQDGAAEGADQ
jgi:hypothetical protein